MNARCCTVACYTPIVSVSVASSSMCLNLPLSTMRKWWRIGLTLSSDLMGNLLSYHHGDG